MADCISVALTHIRGPDDVAGFAMETVLISGGGLRWQHGEMRSTLRALVATLNASSPNYSGYEDRGPDGNQNVASRRNLRSVLDVRYDEHADTDQCSDDDDDTGHRPFAVVLVMLFNCHDPKHSLICDSPRKLQHRRTKRETTTEGAEARLALGLLMQQFGEHERDGAAACVATVFHAVHEAALAHL